MNHDPEPDPEPMSADHQFGNDIAWLWLDLEGTILSADRQARVLFDAEAVPSLTGLHLREVLQSTGDGDDLLLLAGKAVKAGKIHLDEFTWTVRTRNGTTLQLLCQVNFIHNPAVTRPSLHVYMRRDTSLAEESVAPESEDQGDSTSHVSSGDDKGKYVLVVDDDPSVLELMSSILASEGWNVTPCRDGRDAVALLAAQRFDLVLTDIQMPYLGGYGVIDAVRRLPKGVQPYLAVVSGLLIPSETAHLRRLGVETVLGKPFGVSELLSLARQVQCSCRSC